MKFILLSLLLIFSQHSNAADLFNGEYRQSLKVVDYQNYTEELCKTAAESWNGSDCMTDGYGSTTISQIENLPNIYYAEIFTIDARAGFCSLHIELQKSGDQLNFQKDDCSLSIKKDGAGILQIKETNCSALANCADDVSVSGSFTKVYDRPAIPRSSEI